MLSPTASSPGAPVFSVQCTIGLFWSGGAFGFFKCPTASRWQTLQFSTCAPVLGRSLFFTIVNVCGSWEFALSNANVSIVPLLTVIEPGAKAMLSWMYLFGANVTPASLARTVTPLAAVVLGAAGANATQTPQATTAPTSTPTDRRRSI